jgi:hypothetical protein
MDQSKLTEKLEDLHDQLDKTSVTDDESRQLLQHLKGDIQTALVRPSPAAHASLRARLDMAAAHFEDSHPDLTLTLKQVIDHLAQV